MGTVLGHAIRGPGVSSPPSATAHLLEYLRDVEHGRQLSPNTVAAYRRDLYELAAFLDRFYKDRPGAAFQTQLYFLLSRFQQQQEIVQRELFQRADDMSERRIHDRVCSRLASTPVMDNRPAYSSTRNSR